MKNTSFLSDFDAHPYTENAFFRMFFYRFVSDLKIARDELGLYLTDVDFGTTTLSIKKRFFSVHEKTCERKDSW